MKLSDLVKEEIRYMISRFNSTLISYEATVNQGGIFRDLKRPEPLCGPVGANFDLARKSFELVYFCAMIDLWCKSWTDSFHSV